MSLSYSGSLPRSSGSAPDLSSVPDGGPLSPITDIWTNPLNMEGGTVSPYKKKLKENYLKKIDYFNWTGIVNKDCFKNVANL